MYNYDDYDSDFSNNQHFEKQIIASSVTGKVKWFNFKRGFGFIHRDDIDEDIFVYNESILRVRPGVTKSLADDEDVRFDVVNGKKGSEAINVTGPNGEPVQGSIYATTRGGGYSRGRRNMITKSSYTDNNYSRGGAPSRGTAERQHSSSMSHDHGYDVMDEFGGEERPRGRGGRSRFMSIHSRDYSSGAVERGRGGASSIGRGDLYNNTFRGRRPLRRNFNRGF